MQRLPASILLGDVLSYLDEESVCNLLLVGKWIRKLCLEYTPTIKVVAEFNVQKLENYPNISLIYLDITHPQRGECSLGNGLNGDCGNLIQKKEFVDRIVRCDNVRITIPSNSLVDTYCVYLTHYLKKWKCSYIYILFSRWGISEMCNNYVLQLLQELSNTGDFKETMMILTFFSLPSFTNLKLQLSTNNFKLLKFNLVEEPYKPLHSLDIIILDEDIRVHLNASDIELNYKNLEVLKTSDDPFENEEEEEEEDDGETSEEDHVSEDDVDEDDGTEEIALGE